MRTLSDVAEFLSGGTPQKNVKEYWGGNIPWYSASNMTRRFLSETDVRLTEKGLEAASRLAPSGSTLLLVRGSGLFNYIPICYADRPVAFNQDVKAICPNENADPLFLHYWIESLRQKLKDNIGVTGIGAGKFDTKFLKELPFPELDRDQQVELGLLASVFDRKIELNRQMNHTLEAMARAIFKAWFVDFEPVKAKAAGATSFRGMPQAVFDQLPARLTESELGPVPEGWGVVPLSSVIELVGGGTPKRKSPEYWGGEIPWFSVRDAPYESDVWVIDTKEKITQLGVENSSAKVMPEGTTIVSARGTVGRLALTAVPMAMNQSCYGVRGKDSVGDFFVYFTLHDAVADLQQRTHGSVFDTITRKTFEGLTRVRPDTDSLKAFEEVVAPFVLRIRSNLFESQILASIRDTLLPKLISGEIRVPEALEDADGG